MTLVSIVTPCFRGERYLEGYFGALLAQTMLDRIEVVLVHNEPSPEELAIVDRVAAGHPGLIRHVIFPEDWDPMSAEARGRRSIATVSQSVNRGAAASVGRYVALWNVDDVRLPDSIEAEVRTLEQHPDALMTYGDFIIVPAFGATEGELIVTPEFDRREFMTECHGAFQMWRREAFEKTGPCDEQFLCTYDYDLWVRFAANGELVRTPQVLGYFTDAQSGLSTTPDALQPTERTVVELRYGMLRKVDRRYLAAASRYRVGELRVGEEWLPVDGFVPDLRGLLERAAADPALQPRPTMRQRLQLSRKRMICRIRNLPNRLRSLFGSHGGRP